MKYCLVCEKEKLSNRGSYCLDCREKIRIEKDRLRKQDKKMRSKPLTLKDVDEMIAGRYTTIKTR